MRVSSECILSRARPPRACAGFVTTSVCSHPAKAIVLSEMGGKWINKPVHIFTNAFFALQANTQIYQEKYGKLHLIFFFTFSPHVMHRLREHERFVLCRYSQRHHRSYRRRAERVAVWHSSARGKMGKGAWGVRQNIENTQWWKIEFCSCLLGSRCSCCSLCEL